MPDADWWDLAPRDDLGLLVRDVPHLEAEVRRLRSALRRIADRLAGPRSWPELHVAARMARACAEDALAPARRGPRSSRPGAPATSSPAPSPGLRRPR